MNSSLSSSNLSTYQSVDNDHVQIQLQDTTGNWRTYHVTVNNSQMILTEMKNLQSRHQNQRVRAVDMDGRIIDILWEKMLILIPPEYIMTK